MESVKKFIEKDLGLTINEKKSKVCGATTATFLGFNIQNHMGKSDADQVELLRNDSKRKSENYRAVKGLEHSKRL